MYALEYDERKSQRNLKKHGIDFVEAQALWSDPYLVEIPARTTDEVRFLVVGKIQEKQHALKSVGSSVRQSGKVWHGSWVTGTGRVCCAALVALIFHNQKTEQSVRENQISKFIRVS